MPKAWKKLDHYSRAYLPSFLISAGLLAFLITTGEMVLPEWFLSFIPITYFVSTQLSSATAFAQVLDLSNKESEEQKKYRFWQREYWKNFKNKYEFLGTLLGIAAVLAIGITLAVKTVATELFPIVNTALLMYSCINVVANYAMRVGRSFDDNGLEKPDRPPIEHTATRLGAAAGLALSAVLVGLGLFTAVSVVGFTSFISGGAAVPLWVGATAFMLHVSSSTSATAYYLARAKTFLKVTFNLGESDPLEKETITTKKPHEYKGSTVGIFAGFTIGTTVAALLLAGVVASSILTFGAPVAAIAATLLITSCMSIVGGLCSRVGRFMDKYQAAKVAIQTEEDTEKQKSPEKEQTDSSMPSLTISLGPDLTSRSEATPISSSSPLTASPTASPVNVSQNKNGLFSANGIQPQTPTAEKTTQFTADEAQPIHQARNTSNT